MIFAALDTTWAKLLYAIHSQHITYIFLHKNNKNVPQLTHEAQLFGHFLLVQGFTNIETFCHCKAG